MNFEEKFRLLTTGKSIVVEPEWFEKSEVILYGVVSAVEFEKGIKITIKGDLASVESSFLGPLMFMTVDNKGVSALVLDLDKIKINDTSLKQILLACR